MKIIGGHDYYDSALAYGRDEDLIFLREDKIMPAKECPLVPIYPWEIVAPNKKYNLWGNSCSIKTRNNEYCLISISVYVAGKHYGGIKAVDFAVGAKDSRNFWNYEEFCDWVESFDMKIFHPKDDWISWTDSEEKEKKLFPNLETWFTSRDATQEELDWLIANKVAIAIHCDVTDRNYYWRHRKPDNWHINCASKEFNLKDLDFAKVVDPYTLFQELSMFVGGVLPRDSNPMVEITDDKVKIAKHGFDKWTFRKHKDQQ